MPLYTATLNPQSPRYQEWRMILESDDVPLLSPHEHAAEFNSHLSKESERVYLLDLPRLTPEQYNRLVDHVARRFGAARSEVSHAIEVSGFPIRTADCIVAFSLRAFM